MRRTIIITTSMLVLAIAILPCQAQEVIDSTSITSEADTEIYIPRIRSTRQTASTSDDYVTGLPWMGYGTGGWDLHEGLNAQVGAGVRVGWGKNNPWKGASFFTDLAAMYCTPISKDGRWNVAVGGYFSNYRLWGRQANSVGICGLVNYQFNDRIDLSGYVMHDFGVIGGHAANSPFMPFLEEPHTTIGAQLGINISEKARLEIGLSFTRQNNPFHYGYDSTGRPQSIRSTRSILDPDF
ncbi:MAG: hypothetical protein ACI4B5_08090 [Bacteroidaceae bacterium]